MSLLVFNTFLCRRFVNISSCLMSLFKSQVTALGSEHFTLHISST